MKKRLLSYLPQVLLDTCEFPLLCLAEQPEFDAYVQAAQEVFDSQLIVTAPQKAVERYEKIFGIIAKDTESLEERRLRLIARLNERLPYTVRRLREILNNLYGENGYDIEIDHEKYLLTVRFNLSKGSSFSEELFERIIPANLQLTITLIPPEAYVYVGFWSHELTDHTYQMISRPNFKIKEGRLYGGFAVCESTFYRYEMRGDEFV